MLTLSSPMRSGRGRGSEPAFGREIRSTRSKVTGTITADSWSHDCATRSSSRVPAGAGSGRGTPMASTASWITARAPCCAAVGVVCPVGRGQLKPVYISFKARTASDTIFRRRLARWGRLLVVQERSETARL
eukprot:2913315-Pyramimonas_sp.AAC.1